MTPITIPSGCYLLVDIPKLATIIEITDNRDRVVFWYDGWFSELELPEGQWEIIGKGYGLDASKWKEIVEARKLVAGLYERYTDYTDSSNWFKNATQSGLSWLSSHSKVAERTLIIKQVK